MTAVTDSMSGAIGSSNVPSIAGTGSPIDWTRRPIAPPMPSATAWQNVWMSAVIGPMLERIGGVLPLTVVWTAEATDQTGVRIVETAEQTDARIGAADRAKSSIELGPCWVTPQLWPQLARGG